MPLSGCAVLLYLAGGNVIAPLKECWRGIPLLFAFDQKCVCPNLSATGQVRSVSNSAMRSTNQRRNAGIGHRGAVWPVIASKQSMASPFAIMSMEVIFLAG